MDSTSINGSHKQTLAEKYDIGLDKLEPKYIEGCTNVKELEKILRILRSGEEGHFAHIETLCELKISTLAPKSRILRKETPLISTKELPDKDNIVDDIKSWTAEMKNKDSYLGGSDGGGGDENLPPVRSGTKLVGTTKKSVNAEQIKKAKKPMPKDYREWDKIISNLDEGEEEEEKQTEKSSESDEIKKPSRSLQSQVSTEGLTAEEKVNVANREKDKGNEAFRSGDFMEAIVYYNRSLSVLPIAATYNNRALAYIRVSKWSDAVADCNRVLSEEPDNIKAKLRRACAYKSLRKFKLAKSDLDEVLTVERQNKRAQDLLKDVSKELAKQDERKAEGKGNRMVIEETDGESEDEEVEEIVIKGSVETKTSTVNVEASEEVTQSRPDEPEQKIKSQPRKIVIEEDSDDNSSEAEEGGEDEKVSSNDAHAAPDSPTGSDSSANDSPTADGIKSKKTANRTNSLLSIIQQKIATTPNSEQADNHLGNGDTENSSTCAENSNASADAAGDNAVPCGTPSTSNNGASASNEDSGITFTAHSNGVDSKQETENIEQTTSNGVSSAAGQSEESDSKTIAEENSEKADGEVYEASHVNQVIQVPALPAKVESLKTKGNDLFKSGQYGEAVKYYTQAISALSGDEDRSYHRATIYSNRSACHIKIGDCRAAVNDCTAALELTPHNAKALLRRATANEMLERYLDAYVDYRHVINVDSSASTAYIGANRCEKMLSDERGMKWRANVPKIPSCTNLPKYEVEGGAAKSSAPPPPLTSSATDHAPTTQAQPDKPATSTPSTYHVIESNEAKFNRLKDQGNKLVAKGEFEQARVHYTEAIDLYPDRVAPYSNRALCHLKSNNPGLTIKDCDTVLAIESNHVKAMYRRALANKMLSKYKESLSDLMNILKVEPGNSPAKKESELIKAAYRKQLQTMKQSESSSVTSNAAKQSSTSQNKSQSKKQSGDDSSKHTTQPSKPPTRVLIEEGSDSDPEQPTISPSPATAQTNQSKNKSRQKKKKQAKKSAAAKISQSEQANTSTVPTLSANPTPYEFTQAWTAMRHISDTEPYAQLIRQIPPKRLATVVSNKLEAEMLDKIIVSLDNHFTNDELGQVESYLQSLATVPRFSMITMFMSAVCKAALESLFTKLAPVSSHVDKLRIAYGCK